MMKQIILIFLSLNIIFSAIVNEERALNIAENFYYSKNDPRTNSFNISMIDNYTIEDEVIFYIFNLEPNGFMLISANDLIRPVLAYGYTENYRNETLPVNIQYLFDLDQSLVQFDQ